MRSEYLRDRVTTLLSRYSPPRAMQKNTKAQQQEVDAILRVLGTHMPTTGYEEWWIGFEDRLLTSHDTRAWPTIAEFKRAANTGTRSPDAMSEARLQHMAEEWAVNHRRPHPALNTPEITARLIGMGILSDLREARWLGFDLSEKDLKAARDMPCGDEEWRRHVTLMSGLLGLSYEETERREVQTFKNRGELPKRFQGVAA